MSLEKVNFFGLKGNWIVQIIIANNKMKDFLTPSKIEEYSLSSSEIAKLIKATGKIENYIKDDVI
ncbi:MAG: hypothetical protein K6D97_02720 [Clostridia bacterium]|nr:hypothetical protein [Clostridia bacterium]